MLQCSHNKPCVNRTERKANTLRRDNESLWVLYGFLGIDLSPWGNKDRPHWSRRHAWAKGLGLAGNAFHEIRIPSISQDSSSFPCYFVTGEVAPG